MHLKALKPWFNIDHEGHVTPGQFFEAPDYRGQELIRSGLAEAATREDMKIVVAADPPTRKPPTRKGSRS